MRQRQRSLEFIDDRTIDDRFEEFLQQCPDVYPMFRDLAVKLRDKGHRHYDAKGIVEVIRFHRATSGKDRDGWKINNNFTSRLSRKLIADDPSFAGFFEFRKLKETPE
jgi:hypothetical protein